MTVKTLAEMDVPEPLLSASGRSAAIANLKAHPELFPRPDNWGPLEAALYGQDMLVIITNTPDLHSAPAWGGMHHIDQSRFNPTKLANRAAAGLSTTPWFMTYTESFAYFDDPVFWAKRWIISETERQNLLSDLVAHGQQIAQDMAPSAFDKLVPVVALAAASFFAAPAIMGAFSGATTAGAAAGTAATTTATATAAADAGTTSLYSLSGMGSGLTGSIGATGTGFGTGALTAAADSGVAMGAGIGGGMGAAGVATGFGTSVLTAASASTLGVMQMGQTVVQATSGLSLNDVISFVQKAGNTVSGAVRDLSGVAASAGKLAATAATVQSLSAQKKQTPVYPAQPVQVATGTSGSASGGASSLLMFAAVALAVVILI